MHKVRTNKIEFLEKKDIKKKKTSKLVNYVKHSITVGNKLRIIAVITLVYIAKVRSKIK